jgi:hypothetical protein
LERFIQNRIYSYLTKDEQRKATKRAIYKQFCYHFSKRGGLRKPFFIAYSLWQTKFWHQHLVGSVIPFLRLNDFKKNSIHNLD